MANTIICTKQRSNELTCPSCVPKIDPALKALPRMQKAEVKFATGRIEVDHDPGLTDVAALVNIIAKFGYTGKPSAF